MFFKLSAPPIEQMNHGGTKVEVCAGEGNLSRALQQCGYKTKAFDVSRLTWFIPYGFEWKQKFWLLLIRPGNTFATWCKVRYSANHNLLRTVGFITILAAVGIPGTEYLRVSHGGDGDLNRAALETNMI